MAGNRQKSLTQISERNLGNTFSLELMNKEKQWVIKTAIPPLSREIGVVFMMKSNAL